MNVHQYKEDFWELLWKLSKYYNDNIKIILYSLNYVSFENSRN